MNASIRWLAVLVGTPVLMVCTSNAEEPKAAVETTQRAKSQVKNAGLNAAVSKDTKARFEASSKPPVSAAKTQGPEQQVRQTPRDRPTMAKDGEKAASPPRPVTVPPNMWRMLPNRNGMPPNPFQQPAAAIPTAATIGGRLPLQYMGPGVQRTHSRSRNLRRSGRSAARTGANGANGAARAAGRNGLRVAARFTATPQ